MEVLENLNWTLKNRRNIEERKWKAALIIQIKYWRVVLETCVKDKKLLQLTSNRKELSTQQLEDNLLCVIKGMEKEEPVTENVSTYGASDVRWKIIEEYVAKKEITCKHSTNICYKTVATWPSQHSKQVYPAHVDKRWKATMDQRKSIKSLGKYYWSRMWPEVQYVDEQGVLNVKLYEDFLNNDLVIM